MKNVKSSKEQKIQIIQEYFDEHFKFQKLVNGATLNTEKLRKLSEEELQQFIEENCK